MFSLLYQNIILNWRVDHPMVPALPKAALIKIFSDILKMVGVVLFASVATFIMGS